MKKHSCFIYHFIVFILGKGVFNESSSNIGIHFFINILKLKSKFNADASIQLLLIHVAYIDSSE